MEKHEDIKQLQIQKIRLIFQKRYEFPIPEHCDHFIARCIRSKDGDINKAVILAKAYYDAITDMATWGIPVLPSVYDHYYQSRAPTPLIRRDTESRIYVIRPGLWDHKRLPFDEAVVAIWILGQFINAECVDVQKHGWTVIWDFSGFTLQQVWTFKHHTMVKCFQWIQSGSGGRMKAVHVIFHPRVISMIYTGLKPILKEKLKKRVFFHGNSVESLHKHINPSSLPAHLGGIWPNDSADIVDKAILKDVIGNDEYFKEMLKCGFPSK